MQDKKIMRHLMVDFYLYWVADGRKMVGEYTL